MIRSRLIGVTMLLLLGACEPIPLKSGANTQNVRTLDNELDTHGRSYTWARINDPTGTAPADRVERFALRDGHCKGWDCENSRARVESHNITELQDGDRLRYSYSLYFPSDEYNVVQGISTTVGQLYLSGSSSSFSGNPIWDLNTTETGRNWYMRMLSPIPGTDPIETKTVRRINLGSIPFDRWIRITVDAGLSSGQDGYIEAFVDGRSVGRSSEANILPGAYLEYDYGIYQKLFGRLSRNGGVREGIPEQVVLFSGVSITRPTEE